jgi:hypothetical protein
VTVRLAVCITTALGIAMSDCGPTSALPVHLLSRDAVLAFVAALYSPVQS